jgi:hypothetical protein
VAAKRKEPQRATGEEQRDKAPRARGGKSRAQQKSTQSSGNSQGDDPEEDRQRGSNQGTKRTRGRPNGTMGDRTQDPCQQRKAEDSETAEYETLTGKKGNQGMAPRQTERPGPRRVKKWEPRGEGAGIEGKKEIMDKGKGEGAERRCTPSKGLNHK